MSTTATMPPWAQKLLDDLRESRERFEQLLHDITTPDERPKLTVVQGGRDDA